jgi:hypothetical protein
MIDLRMRDSRARVVALAALGLSGCKGSNATSDAVAPPGEHDAMPADGARAGGDALLDGPTWDGDTPAADAAIDTAAPRDAACGTPGQPCCPGNICGGGGCCAGCVCIGAGASCGPAGGTCTDGSCGACGGPGQPCCALLCTAPGTRCNTTDGRCEPCGGVGERCCSGDACTATGTACDSSLHCAPCGEPGGVCCPGATCHGDGCCFNHSCIAAGATCKDVSVPKGGGTCGGGRCADCGQPGQPCCAFVGCQGPSVTCANSICRHCGGPGEPCCSTVPYCASADTACGPLGTCRHCGGVGEPCCADDVKCGAGGCCVNHACVAPGQTCVVEGVPFGACQAGSCTGCGQTDDRCCHSEIEQPACSDPSAICTVLDKCTLCGKPGQPCCPNQVCEGQGCCVPREYNRNPVCVAPGQLCDQFVGICQNGSCGGCGALGQPCCWGNRGSCTASYAACNQTPLGGPTAICVPLLPAAAMCRDPV